MRDNLEQYVNLLFAAAPTSGEIRQEILQNTLDRYDDLIAQGRSEAEAYRLSIQSIGDLNDILGTYPELPPYSSSTVPAAPQIVEEANDDPSQKSESTYEAQGAGQSTYHSGNTGSYRSQASGSGYSSSREPRPRRPIWAYFQAFLQVADRQSLRAIGVALFILCPVPAILLGDIWEGLAVCAFLCTVALGVYLMCYSSKKASQPDQPPYQVIRALISHIFHTDDQQQLRSTAIILFVLCPVPCLLLGDLWEELGVSMLFLMVALGVLILMATSKSASKATWDAPVYNSETQEFHYETQESHSEHYQEHTSARRPIKVRKPLRSAIHRFIRVLGLILYFLVSFSTRAWYITWLIFPLIGAVNGLVKAIFDAMEESSYEN